MHHLIERMPIVLHSIDLKQATLKLKIGAIGHHDHKSIHLDRAAVVIIEPSEASDWQKLLDQWARPMQDLLTVAIGRTVQMTSVRLRPADPPPWSVRGGLEARFRTIQPTSLHLAGETPTPTEDFASYTSPSLVTANSLGENLPNVVANWFRNWPEHSGVAALLTSHMYAPFTYTSHRYGAVFQAIEGLHGILFPSKEKETGQHNARVDAIVAASTKEGVSTEDAAWAERVLRATNSKTLRQRIDEVVENAGELGAAVIAGTEEFGAMATRLRTGVAHPSSGDDDTAKAVTVAQYWYGEILLWIGRSTLLSQAGAQEVYARAAGNSTFKHALKEVVKARVPRPKRKRRK